MDWLRNSSDRKVLKIGIDISQLAYRETGVADYLEGLVTKLLEIDKKNEYVLFFSSMRLDLKPHILRLISTSNNLVIKKYRLPLSLLDLLWNWLHIAPIEWFVGKIDWFITSDWVEPPSKKAKKATILYDLIVYKHPEETDKAILETQKRKLDWVKKESDIVFCISESTKKDTMDILGIEEKRLKVIFPGLTK